MDDFNDLTEKVFATPRQSVMGAGRLSTLQLIALDHVTRSLEGRTYDRLQALAVLTVYDSLPAAERAALMRLRGPELYQVACRALAANEGAVVG